VPSTSGSYGADRVTKTVYDTASEVLQVRRAVGTPLEQAYATSSYTPNGRQEYVLDASGNRAMFQYDGFDRAAKWLFPSPSGPGAYSFATPAAAFASAGSLNASDYEQYGYDAGGNRTSLRKRDGSTLTYSYDALGRMTARLVPARTDLAATYTRSVYYGYDLRGLMTSALFDSAGGGEGLLTSFDRAGRPTGSTIMMDGVSRTIRSCYDANGNRTRTGFPDSGGGGDCTIAWSGAVDYAFDGRNRAKTVTAGSPAWSHSYSYDATSGDLAATTLSGGAGTTGLGRDPIGRLTSLARDVAGTTSDITATFSYNPASQVVAETRGNDAYAYTNNLVVSRPYVANGLNQYASDYGDSALNSLRLGPRLAGASLHPRCASSPASHASDPTGRPIDSARRNRIVHCSSSDNSSSA